MSENQISCPICEHVLVTEAIAEDMAARRWTGIPCRHTLFVAVNSMAFCCFEYRSRLFNSYLGVPDDPEMDVQIPSDEDENEPMPFEEVVQRIDLTGYHWLMCGDGFFLVYIGFVPD